MTVKLAGWVVLPLVLASAALLGGCGGPPTAPVSGVQPVGGFLPDPSLLQPGTSGQADLVYFRPNTNWASYHKVLLEPVTVWRDPSAASNISPDERKALADAFYTNVYNALAQRCQMVDRHSPGTAVIRLAVVGATPSDATMDTISTYVPQARTLETLASHAFNSGTAYFTGQVTAEGYARDASSGALLWQAVDKRAGTKSVHRDTLNSWGDVDDAFKAWGDQFATNI